MYNGYLSNKKPVFLRKQEDILNKILYCMQNRKHSTSHKKNYLLTLVSPGGYLPLHLHIGKLRQQLLRSHLQLSKWSADKRFVNTQLNHLPMWSAEMYTLFLKTKIYLESALQVLSVLSIFPQRTLSSKIKWPLSKKEWQLQLRLAIKKICTGTLSSIGIVWKKSFQNFFVLPPKPLNGLTALKIAQPH